MGLAISQDWVTRIESMVGDEEALLSAIPEVEVDTDLTDSERAEVLGRITRYLDGYDDERAAVLVERADAALTGPVVDDDIPDFDFDLSREGSAVLTEAVMLYHEDLHPRDRLGRWRRKFLDALRGKGPKLHRVSAPEGSADLRLSDAQIKAAPDHELWKLYDAMGEADNAAQRDLHSDEMKRMAAELDRRGQKSDQGKKLGYTDIKGENHVHSTYSDGHHSIDEIAAHAVERGLQHIVISDHAHHMTAEDIRRQHAEIDRLNKKYGAKLRIVKGIEANVMQDGTLDVSDELLSTLGHVNVGLHHERDLNPTERLLKVMDNPRVHVLAHPHMSEGVDYDKLAAKAAKKEIAFEVNGRDMLRRDREEQAAEMIRAALKHGVKLQIASDAHMTHNLVDTRYAIHHARRQGVERKHLYTKSP